MSWTPWRNRTYGYRDEDWILARRVARMKLIEAAQARRLLTPTEGIARPIAEAVPRVNLTSLALRQSVLPTLLAQVSMEEHEADRPLLSALVINSALGMPPAGFFAMVRDETGRAAVTESNEAIWGRELARVLRHWIA